MKTDLYTKVILTVIAACLVYFTLSQLQIFPSVKANTNKLTDKNYALVPVKANGSIDVNLVSTLSTVDVNIEEVGGLTCDEVPVKVKNNQVTVWCDNCK